MGEAFICRRGGGAVMSFASILVKYPAGATCTCTNGSKTLAAKDTSGVAIFYIPSAGTWTVKAVSGTKSVSTPVSITTKGQIETVTLQFDLILFDGTDNTAVTGGFKTQVGNGTSAQVTDSYIANGSLEIYTGANSYAGTYPSNKIDITKYSTLYVDFACSVNLQYVACAGIIRPGTAITTVMDAGISAASYFVARQDFVKGNNSLAIPVDSLSGEQQFLLMYFTSGGGYVDISNIRFA